MNWFKRSALILLFVAVIIFFFKPFFFEGRLPIPSDTIVGLYHPFRDLYAKDYPNGIPFKNFLITDPVRQQYPWRELAIDEIKKTQLPLWNPYSMTGYPILGNQQSAPLYPLNILFFILPFSFAWSILILLQPLLGGLFLYLYLRNLQLNSWASLLGALVFAFSGFSIAWMEWGTILHSALWLPLILLSIDKVFFSFQARKISNYKWPILFVFSLASSLFAGHLQTFFYVFLLSTIYLVARWWQYDRSKKVLIAFIIYHLSFIILTAVQWVPTLQLIGESARGVDLDWQKEGWFIPWQHLIQFVAPDFFGNPTTLNYWGAWNYGELIGYIGIVPLLMALFALIARRDKKTIFWACMFVFSLAFALPTIVAKLPYQLGIPLLATVQPTRLLFVTDLSLAVLSALGLDLFLKNQKKAWYSVALVGTMFIGLWLFVLLGRDVVSAENLEVANRNLRFPTVLFVVSMVIFASFRFLPRGKIVTLILCCTLVGVTVFDLIRFGWKFTPFTNKEYLFPSTSVIEFLQKQQGQFRIMTTDDRILPPNFSTVYRIQTVDGYDPLYLRRFGELIAASERGRPDISPPFGFNRIITPQNYDSKIIDLLGVRYVLSLAALNSEKLTKVFQEGQTIVYENKNAMPRAFFVDEIIPVTNSYEAIRAMFESDFGPRRVAVVENYRGVLSGTPRGCTCEARIASYSENRVSIETKSESDGFLVLTDSFYPTWKARIDGVETIIYRTDYHFRGVAVSKGDHRIEFYTQLL